MNFQKTVFFVFILVLITGFLSAQTNDPQFYSDYSTGFRGYSVAAYFTEEQGENALLNLADVGTYVQKMTRRNKWLCEQALNEWDTEPSEYYLIFCIDSVTSENVLITLAMIKEDGESFDWVAKVLTMEEVESFGNLQSKKP